MNNYFKPEMLTQPIGLTILAGSILLASLSTIQISLVFLFISFVADFATGIFASWIEWKNKKLKVKTYLIESMKLRKSISKAIAYMAFVGFTYGVEALFFIKSFKLSVTDKELTITLIAVGVCIAIEFFSVLENMKRSGFDLIGKIRRVAKNVWNVINDVKGNSDEL